MILHREEYDLETGEKRRVPREQWIVLENALPALITRQEHDRVLKALSGRSRKKQVPVYHGKYPLSGKLVCGQCGSVFYRLKGEKSIRWKCARAVNEGRDRGEGTGCSSPILSQELLFSLLGKTLTEERWLEKQKEVFLKDLCMVLKMGEDRGQKEDREKEKERQRLIRRKREKLLEKLLAGVVEDEDYRQMMERLNREEKAQKGVLADIKEENRPYTDSRAHFLKLQEQIEEKHLWEEAVARALLQEIRQIGVQEDGRLDIQFAAYREPGVYYGRTETGGGEILSLFYPVRPEGKNRSGSARGSGNDHAQDGEYGRGRAGYGFLWTVLSDHAHPACHNGFFYYKWRKQNHPSFCGNDGRLGAGRVYPVLISGKRAYCIRRNLSYHADDLGAGGCRRLR